MSELTETFNIADGVKELIIRRGDVLPPDPKPVPLKISGLLINPYQYLSSRRHLIPKDKSNLVVNKNEGSLTFTIDDKDTLKDVITGKLTLSKSFERFGINEAKYWTDKELAAFFRKTKYFFTDSGVHATVVAALMNFQAKVNTNIEKNADMKGNMKLAFERTVNSNVPESFFINVPIFEGYPAIKLEVFIGAEATNSDVKFFLESAAIYEIVEKEKEAIISEQIAHFAEFGCAILYV
jgi:hypothetical protein